MSDFELPNNPNNRQWVDAELRLLGGLNMRLFKLLEAIQRTGSINQAAKEIGITYKGGWEMIERANNFAPKVLVTTAVGGSKGGGTRLTATGSAFLELFMQLQREHKQFLGQLNQRLSNNQDIVFLLKRLTMKVSARNQLFGQVVSATAGTVNVTIEIALKGGETLVASITKESADSLGIQKGLTVVGLIKAPQIIVVTDFGGYRLSARNQLTGTVYRIQKGGVNSEVIINLKGGDSLAATLTNDSVEALGLEVGKTATAVFKAGAVILGVAFE
ncbi:MAG: TOBE domain-containing protein [Methylococcales bacterium]